MRPRLALRDATDDAGRSYDVLVFDDVVVVVPDPRPMMPPNLLDLLARLVTRIVRPFTRDPLLPVGAPSRGQAVPVGDIGRVHVEARLHVRAVLALDDRRFTVARKDGYDPEVWEAALRPVFGDRLTVDDAAWRRWHR